MADPQEQLSELPPTFTAALARDRGLTSRHLARLAAIGEVFELSRGVYRQAAAPESAHLDLLAVHLRAPLAVVCGESALAVHELIDDIPFEVHFAVPRGSHRPTITSPPVRVSQYAADTFSFAVENFEAAPGEPVPVYSAARSIVDEMRLGGAAGRPTALSALNRFLRRSGTAGVAEIREVADKLGATSKIRPVIEAVLA